MKVLLLVTRYPHPNTKGDQSRAWSWVTHLAQEHEVTVVTTGRAEAPDWRAALERHATVHELPSGPVGRGLSAAAAVLAGRPGQVGWMMPRRAWREALRQAADADVVLAMTVRSLHAPVPAPLVIDHVDALSLNLSRRAHGPEPLPVRLAACFEAGRLRRLEQRLSGASAAAIATAREDAEALPVPPEVAVVPVGLDAEPFAEPAGHVRDIDVVLSGNMRYPPNRLAAQQLTEEILPRVREHLPVRAVIVGRAADTLGARGAEVASDVPSVADYLQRSRVAVVPLIGGTGSPYKVLEAGAAGAALVTVPWAAERFGIAAEQAETPEEFAAAIVALLGDEERRRALAAAAMPAVRAHLTPVLAARVQTILEAAARGR